uniref:Uncharacterized protein n=1 Tax=Colobus angolensis palliatus TaxID=336983 RepID=A0A2K5IAB4_COLAP
MPSVLLCSPRLPLSKMGSLPALQGSSPVQPVSPSARGCALVHPGRVPWVLGVPVHRRHPSHGPYEFSIPGPFLGSPSLSLWLR